MNTFPGCLALQQRVLPAYRVAFFDSLANVCERGLSVFAGQPASDEAIATTDYLEIAHHVEARNRHFLHPQNPFYLCWQNEIIDWLEDWQPDALIVEANPRYPNNWRAIAWMHARNKPVLGWGLGAPPHRGSLTPWRNRSRFRLLHSLDGLIAYSRRGAAEYKALGFPPKRIFIAHNAVTPRSTVPQPEHPSMFTERPNILFVGRLQARKRGDNLLRACAALPVDLQPNLVIVGNGPERKKLQALAETIYPQAEFPGEKHGHELEPYYRNADLFVLPGTGGLAVQQAMTYGLPVIAAQGDGTQEDLVRPVNGWQVPPDDVESLRSVLRDALSDPSQLRQKGVQSYRIILEEINIEAMVEVFLKAIGQIKRRSDITA